MNAKKAKAIRRALRRSHVEWNQAVYVKRNIHMVKEYGIDSEGKQFVISAVEAHTAFLSVACGRKVYKQLKKVAK